ncbi:MAG: EAL domain-containing protein [Gammaproteobacteria bacterium]
MYAAKRSGKNNYQFFDEDMNRRAMDRLIMENAMRKALVNEDFELYFQPQYSVNNGVMTGVEVLLRWEHPQFGNVNPLEFIHLAERTDLIIPLGDWVFQQTCEKMAAWRKQGIEFGRVSINVSAHQFKRRDFADWLLYQLRHYQIDPTKLEIEITESALMEDVEHSLAVLEQLQQEKLRIAIDDFGTGYSSLSYLRRFPISTLKIDKAFIDDIELDKGTLELTQTVIAIAKSLKLGVIAEGVESWGQYRLLHEQGCDEVQGFYLSRALSEADLLELVACEQA